MAVYLPIRAFNRSQGVRINGQKVVTDTTTYVDVDPATTAGKAGRKQLGYHSAIGAVYPVGPLTASNTKFVTVYGFQITQSGTNSKVQTTAAGAYKNRDTGAVTNKAGDSVTLSGAGSDGLCATGKVRVDLVYIDTADNDLKVTAGAEVTSSPVTPTASATQIAVATVAVSDSAISAPVYVQNFA